MIKLCIFLEIVVLTIKSRWILYTIKRDRDKLYLYQCVNLYTHKPIWWLIYVYVWNADAHEFKRIRILKVVLKEKALRIMHMKNKTVSRLFETFHIFLR